VARRAVPVCRDEHATASPVPAHGHVRSVRLDRVNSRHAACSEAAPVSGAKRSSARRNLLLGGVPRATADVGVSCPPMSGSACYRRERMFDQARV